MSSMSRNDPVGPRPLRRPDPEILSRFTDGPDDLRPRLNRTPEGHHPTAGNGLFARENCRRWSSHWSKKNPSTSNGGFIRHYLCLSSVYKSRLDETYSYMTGQRKTGQLKLKKIDADQLMTRHQAVQNSLLESSTCFLSVQCLADALIQWRRLELLRQCRTMESVQPPSLPSKTGQMLKKAGLCWKVT